MKPSFQDRAAALQSCYEDLRAQVLASGRGPGLAIFLHHGMREWMEVCGSCTAVVAGIEPAEAFTHLRFVPPETRSEVVSILAGLVLGMRGEATR